MTVRGAVVRTGVIRPQLTFMAFRCVQCMSVFSVEQPEGIYVLPSACKDPECRSKQFDPLKSHKLTKLIDSRKISVQDVQNSDVRLLYQY